MQYKFGNIKQKLGKASDQFYTELESKVKDCEYSDLEECVLIDKIVCGVLDDAV